MFQALKKLGVQSPFQATNPESVTSALSELNGMISSWFDDDIDMGCVPLEVIGDELSEPQGARNAIIDNLAIQLQPYFRRAVISDRLRVNASMGKTKIEQQWQNIDIPLKKVRGTLPKGAGNQYYEDTFFHEGEEIGA